VELKTLSVAAAEGRSAVAPPFHPQPTAFSSGTMYLVGKKSAAGSVLKLKYDNALRYLRHRRCRLAAGFKPQIAGNLI